MQDQTGAKRLRASADSDDRFFIMDNAWSKFQNPGCFKGNVVMFSGGNHKVVIAELPGF